MILGISLLIGFLVGMLYFLIWLRTPYANGLKGLRQDALFTAGSLAVLVAMAVYVGFR